MTKPEEDLDFRTADARAEARESSRLDEAVTGAEVGPVDPEAMAAAEGLTTTPEEDAAYHEHVERGAHQRGEGSPEV